MSSLDAIFICSEVGQLKLVCAICHAEWLGGLRPGWVWADVSLLLTEIVDC